MRSELEEALSLLKEEDPESIQKAISYLQRSVFAFSMKVCGHREDAEDTMQDVLMNALMHLKKLNDPRALSVWLYTAARNRCWRSRKRQSYRKSIALEDLMPNEAELSALMASAGQSPEAKAATSQEHRLIHRAVLELPVQYRMVLVLHDMEDLDTELVAKILNIRPGTVRVRLHRARLMVRKQLDSLLRGRDAAENSPSARRPSARRRPPECREIFGNLSEYLDGRLEPGNCEKMQAHIERCPAC